MLTIRPEQVVALGRASRRGFVAKLMGHLRRDHHVSARAFPDPVLEEVIQARIARGEALGLVSELALACFVALTFRFPRLDAQPRIRRMLADPRVPPDQRIPRLLRAASPSDWREAKRGGDT